MATFVLLTFAATLLPPFANPTVTGIGSLFIALAAFVVVYLRITPAFRARNLVEAMVLGLLALASTIAVFTTVAIVLSLVFETARFFGQYRWSDFFFGTVWSPAFQGTSQLGMLPLLWGTLYVSFIALAVAVPVGLFIAIYMSRVRRLRLPHGGQAAARDPRRHPHHRLRPLRADHRRADPARLRSPSPPASASSSASAC